MAEPTWLWAATLRMAANGGQTVPWVLTADSPHCFTDKPAFSSRCPQCTRSGGFIGGIIFDLVYKGMAVFFFFAILFGIIVIFL